MQTRVQLWGHSLAIRIPRALAAAAGVRDGVTVDVTVADGVLVLTPRHETIPTLDELLAGITDKNIHAEVDTGPSTGVEAW